MSRLSFKTFCIEFYSNHIQKSSDEVFLLFKQEGLLDLLEKDYEDLHGMSMEYIMQFIDEYLDEAILDLHFILQISKNRQSDGQGERPRFSPENTIKKAFLLFQFMNGMKAIHWKHCP